MQKISSFHLDIMNNIESEMFRRALSNQHFNAYDLKIVLAILEGSANYNQEGIIVLSYHNCFLLRKLEWLRKVKNAIKETGFRMTYLNYDE